MKEIFIVILYHHQEIMEENELRNLELTRRDEGVRYVYTIINKHLVCLMTCG